MTDHVSAVPGPRPDLASVLADIDTLRRDVDALAGLAAQVRDLADVVAALADRPGGRSGARLPSWLTLSADFPETVAVLGELVAWLRTVYLRYVDACLPECWLWHPDVVEELLWLRAAWLEAYAGDAASVVRAGDWHERQRPGVIRRIRVVAGMCSLEAHQAGRSRCRGAARVPLAEAIDAIGEWWATDREGAPPVPGTDQIAAAAERRRLRGRR